MAVDLDLVKVDYRASDVGDTIPQFKARLAALEARANDRDASDLEREAWVRHELVGAQIRALTRKAEEIRGASGASVRQDLASRMAALRIEQQQWARAAGLGSSVGTLVRPVSVVYQPEVDC